jgi:hypothetical protein
MFHGDKLFGLKAKEKPERMFCWLGRFLLKVLWVNWGIAKKEWCVIFLSAGIRWVQH